MIESRNRRRIGQRNGTTGAGKTEMLIGVVRGRAPSADFINAGEPGRFLRLINSVLGFRDEQRAAGKAEGRCHKIADLRIAIAVVPGRVAGEHGGT